MTDTTTPRPSIGTLTLHDDDTGDYTPNSDGVGGDGFWFAAANEAATSEEAACRIELTILGAERPSSSGLFQLRLREERE